MRTIQITAGTCRGPPKLQFARNGGHLGARREVRKEAGVIYTHYSGVGEVASRYAKSQTRRPLDSLLRYKVNNPDGDAEYEF